LVANIGSLTLANLQELGFVLPPKFSAVSISNSSFGSTLISWLPFILLFGLLFFLLR
jgi:ATP-dependent Zn protease